MKTCNKCAENKQLNCFYKAKNTADGYKGFCKTCVKSMDKEREELHKEGRYIYFLERRGYVVKRNTEVAHENL